MNAGPERVFYASLDTAPGTGQKVRKFLMEEPPGCRKCFVAGFSPRMYQRLARANVVGPDGNGTGRDKNVLLPVMSYEIRALPISPFASPMKGKPMGSWRIRFFKEFRQSSRAENLVN